MDSPAHRPRWKTLLAFAIIYFVWGSTFLAIRVGVAEVPPFLLASIRFVAAGLALYGWMLERGERSPNWREWQSATLLAALILWATTAYCSGRNGACPQEWPLG